MTYKKKRVLLVAHDNGGANLLIPLLSHWLQADSKISPSFIGSPPLEANVYRRYPGSRSDHKEFIFYQNDDGAWMYNGDQIKEVLEKKEEKWDWVLTGTSLFSNLEKLTWRFAKDQKVPCAAICDMWTEYVRRFKDPDPRGYKLIPPNKVLVLDDRMQSEIRKVFEATPVDINVVGSPYFASIIANNRTSAESRTKVRFISEPAAKYFPGARINEFDIAEIVIGALGDDAKELIIRPHPQDDSEAWRRFIYAHKSKGVHLDEEPSWACHRSTKIAIGISSMMLMELAILDVPVASFKPYGSDESYCCLPEKEFGIATLRSKEELQNWLKNPDRPCVSPEFKALHASAIKNIEDVCLGLTNL